MSESSKSDDSKRREGWTPEDFKNLVEAARPLIEEWIQFQKDKNASFERRISIVSQHNRRLSISLIIFLLIVVGLMSVLTIYGKVTGDALLFLAGTVTGYVIIMIQDLIQPIFMPQPQEED